MPANRSNPGVHHTARQSRDRETSELIRQEETLASFAKSPQLSHRVPGRAEVDSTTIAAGVDGAAP